MFTHPPISHGKLIFYNISSFVDVFDFSIERKTSCEELHCNSKNQFILRSIDIGEGYD
jgi:hypothetical protein